MFDEIDYYYSEKWNSVNNDDGDEEILDILLFVLADAGIPCTIKGKIVEQIVFKNYTQNWSEEEIQSNL